jgi:hypothetical protein
MKKSQNIIWDKHEVTARGHVGKWNGDVQNIETPLLISVEYLRNFKVLRSIGKSHGNCLEHPRMSESILSPMQVVNENGEGGWNLVSPHKWKSWKSVGGRK